MTQTETIVWHKLDADTVLEMDTWYLITRKGFGADEALLLYKDEDAGFVWLVNGEHSVSGADVIAWANMPSGWKE